MPAGLRDRQGLVERLREEIRRIERRPGRRSGAVPSGREDVDALLGGGFARGAITELCGGPASGRTTLVAQVVRALGDDALTAYVDGRGELYPPALQALGVDLGRLLIVRPGAARLGGEVRDPVFAGLWAAEALLGSGAFEAVAIDVPLSRAARGLDSALRRVQTAAEKGGAVGVWLSGPDARVRAPAVARVELERAVARDRRGDARRGRAGHAA